MDIFLIVLGIAVGVSLTHVVYRAFYSFDDDAPNDDAEVKPGLRRPSPRVAPPHRTHPQTTWSQPKVIAGKCYVIDGDTIVINKTHIRLFGIDAPELNHPWGKKAKWEMVQICKGRVITATLDGSSSHNRVVATCRLPDGTDLSEELVRRGLAIDWPKFTGGKYSRFEVEGVRKKLWRCHNRQTGKYVPD